MSPSVLLPALVLATPVSAVEPFETDLSDVFEDFDSCFLLLDVVTGERRSHGGDCAERSTPASTFKAPHAVLALGWAPRRPTEAAASGGKVQPRLSRSLRGAAMLNP